MSLLDVNLKQEYRSPRDNIVNDFYIPLLKEANINFVGNIEARDILSGEVDVVVADGDPAVKLTDVSFKDGDLFMPLNSTYKIALTLTPSRGYIQNKTFTSSNTRVVTVDNTGLVTAVGEGESTIYFDVNNGEFKKELNVYVDRDYNKTEIIITPEN